MEKEDMYMPVAEEIAYWLNETRPLMRDIMVMFCAVNLVNAILSDNCEQYLFDERTRRVISRISSLIFSLAIPDPEANHDDCEGTVEKFNNGTMQFREPTLSDKREINKCIKYLRKFNIPEPWTQLVAGGELNISNLIKQLGLGDNNVR